MPGLLGRLVASQPVAPPPRGLLGSMQPAIERPTVLERFGRGMWDFYEPVDHLTNTVLERLGAAPAGYTAQQDRDNANGTQLYLQGMGGAKGAERDWARTLGNAAIMSAAGLPQGVVSSTLADLLQWKANRQGTPQENEGLWQYAKWRAQQAANAALDPLASLRGGR